MVNSETDMETDIEEKMETHIHIQSSLINRTNDKTTY